MKELPLLSKWLDLRVALKFLRLCYYIGTQIKDCFFLPYIAVYWVSHAAGLLLSKILSKSVTFNLLLDIYDVVQFYPWFKFYSLLFWIWQCIKMILKQRKKFRARIKWNHKYTCKRGFLTKTAGYRPSSFGLRLSQDPLKCKRITRPLFSWSSWLNKLGQ